MNNIEGKFVAGIDRLGQHPGPDGRSAWLVFFQFAKHFTENALPASLHFPQQRLGDCCSGGICLKMTPPAAAAKSTIGINHHVSDLTGAA